jgi:thymidylate synthase
MAQHDQQYLQLIRECLDQGTLTPTRTGTDTISIFGTQMRFNLRDGTIPLLTTKKMFVRGTIVELLWYLQGSGNIKYLTANNVHIWDEWADSTGNLGPVYGHMWRKWPNEAGPDIDQLSNLISTLRTNPTSRRLLVTSWNPSLLPNEQIPPKDNVAYGKQALPPCHCLWECFARPLSTIERVKIAGQKYNLNDAIELEPDLQKWMNEINTPRYELSLKLTQRSADVGLGVPFNIVQYSMLLRMIAHVTNMVPGDFVWSGGNTHIYSNHVDQLKEQLSRVPYDSPTLTFARHVESIDHFQQEDFLISNYTHHSPIKMEVSV